MAVMNPPEKKLEKCTSVHYVGHVIILYFINIKRGDNNLQELLSHFHNFLNNITLVLHYAF